MAIRRNLPRGLILLGGCSLGRSVPLEVRDVFRTPAGQSLTDSKGRPWVAVMSLHPSCELGRKASPEGVRVVRVFRLGNVSQGQREEVRVGYVERYGESRIARVNTV